MRTNNDSYRAHFKEIVEYCMEQKGKSPKNCFDCGVRLTKLTRQIHHMKYEGATIDDLEFGCPKCNVKPEYLLLV